MTAGSDELFVQIGGKDIGLEALLKKVDAEMARSADQAVKLGQQYARLAQAQGSPAAASQILAGTMQRAGAASEKSLIGISTQAARLQNSSQGLQSTIAGLGGQLSSLGGTAGSLAGSIGNLAGSFGTLGGIGAAIGIAKVGVDMAQAGANADLLRERFDGLAASAGTTGDALLTALRQASGNEINDLNLTLAANKAQLLGVADSAEEFSVLMGIARDRAQQMGISTTQAFNDLTTGLGRGSALILDNLGIIVSVKEANEQYAASLGKTAAALTEAEQKQALINQVLAQGRASLEATGGAVDSTAGSFARAGVAAQNFGSAFGSELAARIGPTLNVLVGINDAWGPFIAGLNGSAAAAAAAAAAQTAETAALTAFDAELARSGDTTQAEIAYQAALAAAMQQATDIEQQRANVLAASTSVAQQAASASLQYADSMAIGTVQANAAALAAQMKAGADQVAGVNAQIHAIEQQKLADAARIAAESLLANGAAGARTAAILAGSSQQVDVLTAAYYRLAQAQQVAAAKDPMKGVSEGRAERDTQADRALVKSNQALEANRALLAKVALAKAKASAAGGGGGGGGVPKLSDQQKLENQLLSSQENYQQKSEDAAAQYAADTQKIYQDFYQKLQTAQRDFDQSQLEGRAGFYDNLGQIENQKIAQAASQQYEAASIEAGKIAQEKGADVAEKYMDAQEQIISNRARRLSEIEKAEKEKDSGRAEYLRGVDAQYKAAEDAKLKRIQEGEGSLAAERDKQLTDAAAKEAEAQEKIGVSVDRAKEKKITAAEAAGLAIDAEKLKVDGLKTSYDQLGTAGSRAGITPSAGAGAAPGTTVAPAASPNAASAAAPVPDLAALFAGLREQLAALERATNAGAEKVAGAVRQRFAG